MKNLVNNVKRTGYTNNNHAVYTFMQNNGTKENNVFFFLGGDFHCTKYINLEYHLFQNHKAGQDEYISLKILVSMRRYD
jgi:hypothetical protein